VSWGFIYITMTEKIYIDEEISVSIIGDWTLRSFRDYINELIEKHGEDTSCEIDVEYDYFMDDYDIDDANLIITTKRLETDSEYNKRIEQLQLRKKKYEKELSNLQKNYSDVLEVIDDELFQIQI